MLLDCLLLRVGDGGGPDIRVARARCSVSGSSGGTLVRKFVYERRSRSSSSSSGRSSREGGVVVNSREVKGVFVAWCLNVYV